jgi:hypothetical protein
MAKIRPMLNAMTARIYTKTLNTANAKPTRTRNCAWIVWTRIRLTHHAMIVRIRTRSRLGACANSTRIKKFVKIVTAKIKTTFYAATKREKTKITNHALTVLVKIKICWSVVIKLGKMFSGKSAGIVKGRTRANLSAAM